MKEFNWGLQLHRDQISQWISPRQSMFNVLAILRMWRIHLAFLLDHSLLLFFFLQFGYLRRTHRYWYKINKLMFSIRYFFCSNDYIFRSFEMLFVHVFSNCLLIFQTNRKKRKTEKWKKSNEESLNRTVVIDLWKNLSLSNLITIRYSVSMHSSHNNHNK